MAQNLKFLEIDMGCKHVQQYESGINGEDDKPEQCVLCGDVCYLCCKCPKWDINNERTQVVVPTDDVSDAEEFDDYDVVQLDVGLGKAGKLAFDQLYEKTLLEMPELKRAPAIRPLSMGDNDIEIIEQPKKRGSPVIRWCVTWNNPDIDGDALANKLIESGLIKGYCFQLEKGASGTPHFQMYMELVKAGHDSVIRKAIGTNALSTFKAKGTKQECIRYCSKDDTRVAGPWKYGSCTDEFKSKQGERTDIARVVHAALEQGVITDELQNEFAVEVMKWRKHIQTEITIKNNNAAILEKHAMIKQRREARAANGGIVPAQFMKKPRKLILFFGPSGVGKTELAEEYADEYYDCVAYEKEGKTKWWDLYKGQPVVLVDEWRKAFTDDLMTFNNLTNEGPIYVETKGSMLQMNAECMLFTSNWHPQHIFKVGWDNGAFRALARRFAEVYWWNDAGELSILKNPGLKPVKIEEMSDEDYQDILNEWQALSDAWVHFWKRLDRPVQEGDQVIIGEPNYFTW